MSCTAIDKVPCLTRPITVNTKCYIDEYVLQRLCENGHV
jgi:hypothetical protein